MTEVPFPSSLSPLPSHIQSAVGFEYQGKTEKHASQKGEYVGGQGQRMMGGTHGATRCDRGGLCSRD